MFVVTVVPVSNPSFDIEYTIHLRDPCDEATFSFSHPPIEYEIYPTNNADEYILDPGAVAVEYPVGAPTDLCPSIVLDVTDSNDDPLDAELFTFLAPSLTIETQDITVAVNSPYYLKVTANFDSA